MAIEDEIAAHRQRALELADECARQAHKYERRGAELRAQERTFRGQAEELGRDLARLDSLTPENRARTLRRMEAEVRARRGRPVKHPHAMLDATNVTEWAERNDVPRRTVRSWMAGERPIPRAWAEKIRDEFTDPATGVSRVPLSAWAKIAD